MTSNILLKHPKRKNVYTICQLKIKSKKSISTLIWNFSRFQEMWVSLLHILGSIPSSFLNKLFSPQNFKLFYIFQDFQFLHSLMNYVWSYQPSFTNLEPSSLISTSSLIENFIRSHLNAKNGNCCYKQTQREVGDHPNHL